MAKHLKALAYGRSLDPDHILYGLLSESLDACQERLTSRRPFVPAARNLSSNLGGLGIPASKWTNHKWDIVNILKYCKITSRFCAFIPRTSARRVGTSLPRTPWVKLNRSRTDVGQFHFSTHKWGLAFSPNVECDASEQTADHVIIACPIRFWMTKLDAGLTKSLSASDPGSTASWDSKRIKPRPQSCLCLTWSGCSFKRQQRRLHLKALYDLYDQKKVGKP